MDGGARVSNEDRELITMALLVLALYALAPMERDPLDSLKQWWRNL